jgi:hypothetical protein
VHRVFIELFLDKLIFINDISALGVASRDPLGKLTRADFRGTRAERMATMCRTSLNGNLLGQCSLHPNPKMKVQRPAPENKNSRA